MKFWQIAAAVFIFKLFDMCMGLAALLAPGSPLALVYIVASFVWVILAAMAWQAFREVDQAVTRGRTRND
jgi:type III secretory pathway component EscT